MHGSKAWEIVQRRSRTYRYAILFLPQYLRESVVVLYAFFRVVDDLVDEAWETPVVEKKLILDACRLVVITGEGGSALSHESIALSREVRRLLLSQRISPDLMDRFFVAMLRDLDPVPMVSYHELRRYNDGSSRVVGEVLATLFGSPPSSLSSAGDLGEAMQISNHLRDVDDDVALRARMYLPDDWQDGHSIGRYAVRAIDFFREGCLGIPHIPELRVRLVVWFSAFAYLGILIKKLFVGKSFLYLFVCRKSIYWLLAAVLAVSPPALSSRLADSGLRFLKRRIAWVA